MKKHFLFLFALLASVVAIQQAHAQTPPPPGQFEVIDVSGQIGGDLTPQLTSDAARDQWTKACQEWKTETKNLNKNNEVLGINCNSPSCNLIDASKWQCISTGTYKVKTAGVRVTSTTAAPPLPEPPVADPLPPNHEIATAPPEVVVEAVPAPRIGFVWIAGYWGWAGRRHVWIPGRWANERPGYIWTQSRWERHGSGWHFEQGRWEGRH